jgi:hypothetical protein
MDTLREIIDREQLFIINSYPSINTLLGNNITIGPLISGPTTAIEYHDPTAEQYAVIQNKERALAALFALTQTGPSVPFEQIFNPPTSNIKETLLTLAIIENHMNIVRYLIEYITDHFPSRIIEFMTLGAKHGRTPLSTAVQYERWEAARLLCEAGVDPIEIDNFSQCPFFTVLFKARDRLSIFEGTGLSERLSEIRWDPRTMRPSPEGLPFEAFLTEVFGAGDFLTSVLEAVRTMVAGALARPPPADVREENPPETLGCEAADCGDTNRKLTKCKQCEHTFCDLHYDDHTCSLDS